MRKGFSLIELSVVIVIIDLLVGVLVAARSIRNAAQVQAVITDLGKYKQAAIQYKEKYYYWPGDDLGASLVWQEIDSSHNGDGDGKIESCQSGPCIGNNLEMFFSFQELSLAGFVTGSYVGAPSTYTPGIVFPKVPLDIVKSGQPVLNSAVYLFMYDDGVVINKKNVITIAGIKYLETYPVINPADAYAIDQKIDDGSPLTGYIAVGTLSNYVYTTSCLNGNNAYNIGASASACILEFRME